MKVYIAARYSRRLSMRGVSHMLTEAGYDVTSRWIWQDEDTEKETFHHYACKDIEDVRQADVIVFFAEPQGSRNPGGGRWFELGMAHEAGKQVVIVGPGQPETVFAGHDSYFRAETPIDLLDVLQEVPKQVG